MEAPFPPSEYGKDSTYDGVRPDLYAVAANALEHADKRDIPSIMAMDESDDDLTPF